MRVLLTLSVALLTGTAGTASAATTWVTQFVDVGTTSGASTSLGLLQGYPVISYFGAPRILKYASLNPQTKIWNLVRVDAGGEFTSLDTEPSGLVHVGYLDGNTLQLKYWRLNQGQSSIQVIDSESGQGGMGFYNSLRVDGQGTPHISYYYWRSPNGLTSNDRLKFADLTGSGWVSVFVDSVAGRGRYNSLALDGSGNPQIAYWDRGSLALRLARRIANVWTTEIVDSAGNAGWFNSIALNALGQPRISYIAATTNQLRYAFSNGAAWTVENVAGVGSVVSFSVTSLALDSGGNPHISYYDAADSSLKYASRSGGGTWTTEVVDGAGDVGGYCSLKLDSQDRPIISYLDATNGALKIAYGGYPDQDSDGIPDAFDPCPTNPDCNSNGILDGREGGVIAGAAGTNRLQDEPIFGCGSLAGLYGGGPPRGGGPPADLLFLLTPALYLLQKRRLRRA